MLQKLTYIVLKIKYSHSRQGEACKGKIVLGKTPRRLTLRRVRLQAVLDTFGSAVNLIVDFAECKPAWSSTPLSVRRFWIFENIRNF